MISTPHTQFGGTKFINITTTTNNKAFKSYICMYDMIFPQTLNVDAEVLLCFYYTNHKTYLPKAFTRATIS